MTTEDTLRLMLRGYLGHETECRCSLCAAFKAGFLMALAVAQDTKSTREKPPSEEVGGG